MSSRRLSNHVLRRVQHDEPAGAGHHGQAPVPGYASEGKQGSRCLLTASEVADLLQVRTSWVYAETRAGRIPHVRLGPRYRRYRWEAIEQWISELERGPVP